MKNAILILFTLISFNLYSQKIENFVGFAGNQISVNPIIQPDNPETPLRNRYSPNFGAGVEITPSIFDIRFTFEAVFDKIFLFQNRFEFGVDCFKIFKKDQRQKLYLVPFGTRYNFQEYEINFYKSLSRYYKIEYQYCLTNKFSLVFSYEKDSKYNFSKNEKTVGGRWDCVIFKLKYTL